MIYFLLCHQLASTTHATELFTGQKFQLYHVADVTHVNEMGNEGDILVFDYSMADDIKCHENTVGSHGLSAPRTN